MLAFLKLIHAVLNTLLGISSLRKLWHISHSLECSLLCLGSTQVEHAWYFCYRVSSKFTADSNLINPFLHSLFKKLKHHHSTTKFRMWSTRKFWSDPHDSHLVQQLTFSINLHDVCIEWCWSDESFLFCRNQ